MALSKWHGGILAACIGIALTACGGAGESDPSVTSQGPAGPSTSSQSLTAPPAVPGTPSSAGRNTAPNITGVPVTSITVGATYAFRPTAVDPDGDALAYSVAGKPDWATFSTATGSLTGTPVPGTYANIVISVSDGTASHALPAFTLNVTQTEATGIAALSWTAPTQNTDGTALSDLVGYRVYHGTSSSELSDVVEISGAGTTAYSFATLPPGTHYFAVAAYTAAGVESAMSGVGSKTIL
jgi:hypothetical protein